MTKRLACCAVLAVWAPFAAISAKQTPLPGRGDSLLQSSLVPIGTFRLPTSTLGSRWGFSSYAGCCGLGTYGVTFNPSRNSLYIGGHPYEQRLAEIAIPAAFDGSPATALSNLIDPLEGKLESINPTDPNTKIIGGTLVYRDRLIVSAYSYYDGAGTQGKSTFARPSNLASVGQVFGPVRIGITYPGWVDRLAALIPAEWQAVLGGPALAGGGGGAINSLQSWGPAASAFDPAQIGTGSSVSATLVLGYPLAHVLPPSMTTSNTLWSQSDNVTGLVFVPGTPSVLFFGLHGQGNFCYGGGTGDKSLVGKTIPGGIDPYCYDPDISSKGGHAYPYASWVWASDANDLAAVRAGRKNSYDVKPYATWNLDPTFTEIQGAAYDPSTRRLYVSQVDGDPQSHQPLIRVYRIQ